MASNWGVNIFLLGVAVPSTQRFALRNLLLQTETSPIHTTIHQFMLALNAWIPAGASRKAAYWVALIFSPKDFGTGFTAKIHEY